MKTHTTMKYIKAIYHSDIYQCGYGDLQFIFNNITADYYNAGVYGWNCDIYCIDGIAITTGYRNMRGATIPHKLIEKYTKKAQNIIDKYDYSEIKKRDNALRKNRQKFIDEVKSL